MLCPCQMHVLLSHLLQHTRVQDLAKEPVVQGDFEQATKRINPSVGPADVKRHLDWAAEFGSG